MEQLPLGTLISHAGTLEIMVVEKYEIEESLEDRPKIKASGRGLDQVLMENRIVTIEGGGDYSYGLAFPGRGYLMYNHSGWYNARELIRKYLKDSDESTDNDVANFDVRSLITTSDSYFFRHYFDKLPTLYEAVLELLSYRNLGIRVERPNTDHGTIDFVIHEGENLSETFSFSWYLGQIHKARYFMSDEKRKNALYVHDNNVMHRIYPGDETGIRARVGKFDASLLELEFSDPPTGPEILEAYDALDALGLLELQRQKTLQIMDAELSANLGTVYGVDYNMGDIVKVIGKYNTEALMRVTEYAIAYDEDGTSAYPTLTNIDPISGDPISEV